MAIIAEIGFIRRYSAFGFLPSGLVWSQGSSPTHKNPSSTVNPPIARATAEVVTQRKSDQHHADLAHPDVERAAKIFGQETSADDLQDHHDKPADEDQCCGRGASHRARVVVKRER